MSGTPTVSFFLHCYPVIQAARRVVPLVRAHRPRLRSFIPRPRVRTVLAIAAPATLATKTPALGGLVCVMLGSGLGPLPMGADVSTLSRAPAYAEAQTPFGGVSSPYPPLSTASLLGGTAADRGSSILSLDKGFVPISNLLATQTLTPSTSLFPSGPSDGDDRSGSGGNRQSDTPVAVPEPASLTLFALALAALAWIRRKTPLRASSVC